MATSSVLANSSKSKPGVTTGNVNINRSNSNGNLTQQNQNFQRQSQTENQNHTHGSIINGFKIAHININHLIHKKNFINELISKNNISIFAVTETWLSGDISGGEISIPHYRVFRRDKTDRRGGGVCIYIHETINFKVLVQLQDPSLEMLWLKVTIGRQDINVGCFYRPPDAKVQLWSTLDGTLESLQGQHIILTGDLNVNTLDNSDSNFSHFEQICLTLQLRNVVQAPTRITPTSSRCLDVILTNVDDLTEGIVEHVDFSDHAMVLATTKHVRVSNAVKPTGIEKTSTKLAKSTCRNTRLSIGAYYESFIIFWI